MIIKKCAIYTRKSPHNNISSQVTSIESQYETCRHYIKANKHNGYKEVQKVYSDYKFSGKDVNRPAFNALIEDIKEGLVNVVIVHKLDRLTRSLSDFAKIMDIFEEYKVDFISVTQDFNTTSSVGKFTLNMLCSFAQFEREIIVERIKDKVKIAKEKGCWLGGYVPFGYKIKNKRLVINKKEAVIVQFIFNYVADRHSVSDLLPLLYKNYGDFRKNISKGWIYRLLSNELYIGNVYHYNNIYKGLHKAIINQKLFNIVRDIISDRNVEPRIKRNNKFLLQGLIYCQYCHSHMRTSHSNKNGKLYLYYRCPNTGKNIKRCYCRYVSSNKIEALVMPFIYSYLEKSCFDIEVCRSTITKSQKANIPPPDKLWEKISFADRKIIVSEIFQQIEVGWPDIIVKFKNGEIKKIDWIERVKIVI